MELQAEAQFDGLRVALRALRSEDHSLIIELEDHPANIRRWRYGGRTPSLEARLGPAGSNGIFLQLLVIEKASLRPVGMVVGYDPDFSNGYCSMAALSVPGYQSTGLLFEGGALFLNYIFTTWPLRKVYAESTSFNLEQFESITHSLFSVEGRLIDHVYLQGQYWDKLILALTRQTFEGRWRESEAAILGGPREGICGEGRRRAVGSPASWLQSLVATMASVPLEELTSTSLLREQIGFDSLSWLEFVVALEDQGLRAPTPELIAEMRTVADLVSYVESAAAESR